MKFFPHTHTPLHTHTLARVHNPQPHFIPQQMAQTGAILEEIIYHCS